MKKGWFFGDSFTKGFGSNPGEEYYELVNGDTTKWSDIICKEYNLEQINFGLSGAANENILVDIQTNFFNTKPGDFVFLQSSCPTRQFFYLKNFDVIFKYGNNKVTSLLKDIKLWVDSPFKTIDASDQLSQEQHDSIGKFILNIRVPAYKRYKDYYSRQFNFYKKLFLQRGCVVVDWEFEQWKDYETIEEATNGTIKDNHWSAKGNKNFAEYISKRISE